MQKYILVLFIFIATACTEKITRFVDPVADFQLPSDTVELLNTVRFVNTGQGEYFSLWTGDDGHNYALKDSGKNNIGLPPNVGRDFLHSYTQSGSFNVVMVASSYDESSSRFSQSVKSKSIYVKPGNDGNFIQMFGIYNIDVDYTPEATNYGDTALVLVLPRLVYVKPGVYINYGTRVNTRPIRFRTNYTRAVVTNSNGDTLYSDISKLNLYDLANNKTNITPINVYGYFGKKRVYNVVTAFYPVVTQIKFTDGSDPSGGVIDVPGTFGAYSATIYRDGLLTKNTTLTYASDPGVVVTMADDTTPLESGVTPITLTSNTHTFKFTSIVDGFKVVSIVTVNIIYI